MTTVDKKLFNKYFVTFIGHIFLFIAGLLIIPIIVKSSGTQVYGAYVVIISLLSILTGIYSFGAGFTVQRYLPSIDNRNERASIFYPQFYFNILSSLILGIIAFQFFPLIEKYFLGHNFEFSRWLIILYLVCHVLYSQTAGIFRYTHHVGLFNIATTMYAYLFLAGVVLWLMLDKIISINSLIISQILAHLSVFLLLIGLSIKAIGFKLIWYKKDKFISDIQYGFPLILVVLLDQIISASDRYIIAAYMDLDFVAFYAIAYSVASIPFLMPRVIGIVLPPIMSRLKDQGKGHRIVSMVNTVISTYIMFMLPFVLALIILGDPLLTLYAGKETATAAAGLLPIISVSILFYGIASILMGILFIDLKTKTIFFINTLIGVVNLLSNIIIFGIVNDIYVAAWTTFASYLLMLFLVYQYIGKEYEVVLYDSSSLKIIFSAAMMFLVLYCLKAMNFDFYTISGLIIAIFTGFSVYFLFLHLTKVAQYKELLSLLGVVKK
jgi:O-antigen/teichoic acid export membrane protein